jgi:hypothetical protein
MKAENDRIIDGLEYYITNLERTLRRIWIKYPGTRELILRELANVAGDGLVCEECGEIFCPHSD